MICYITFPCHLAKIAIATIFIYYRSVTDSRAKLQPGSLSYSLADLSQKLKIITNHCLQCRLIQQCFFKQTIQQWSLLSPFSWKWWPMLSRWSSKCFLLHPDQVDPVVFWGALVNFRNSMTNFFLEWRSYFPEPGGSCLCAWPSKRHRHCRQKFEWT